MSDWRLDPSLVILVVAAATAYGVGVLAYARRRSRAWPTGRILAFVLGLTIVVVAVESPLDAAGETHFASHMVQHLLLTNVAAPMLLLGAPVLLAISAASRPYARSIVSLLRSRPAAFATHPAIAWATFIVTLWAIHFSPFFQAALAHESLHVLEHALFLGTSLIFWLPVIAIGPAPWTTGPLSFPLRMLYLLVAMPAEAFLGFAIFSARHELYPAYLPAGLSDQRTAGEIMWIGSGITMFVAFMLVGWQWARREGAP